MQEPLSVNGLMPVLEPPPKTLWQKLARAFRRPPFWGFLILLVLLSGLITLVLFLFSPFMNEPRASLPFDIHSPLKADYSGEAPGQAFFAPVENRIIVEVLKDTGAPGDLTATLSSLLTAPVATITPLFITPSSTPTNTLSATPVVHTATASNTPRIESSPTLTPSPSLTPSQTVTLTPSPTLTLAPVLDKPTSTPKTGKSIETPKPAATDTQAPPPPEATDTQAPPPPPAATDTQAPPPPRPTDTQAPPPPPAATDTQVPYIPPPEPTNPPPPTDTPKASYP